MQYILTEQEYNELKKKQELEITLNNNKFQELCTKISDTMPIDWGWGEDNPKPWGCILSIKQGWYCDKCPVRKICKYPYKKWSK